LLPEGFDAARGQGEGAPGLAGLGVSGASDRAPDGDVRRLRRVHVGSAFQEDVVPGEGPELFRTGSRQQREDDGGQAPGRIENAQVAVYLVYAGRRGHAAVDHELYVPRSWTCDPDRCQAAGLDEDTVFATKPELAARMIGRFLDTEHRVSWVAGDEVYGGNPKLRSALQERGVGYVLAVACSAEVTTDAGKFRADALAAKVPKRAWQKLSAGAGAKGHRFYDWAIIGLAEPRPGSHQLLIRRNRTTGELAYYRCWSPAPVPLATLVRVAGSRWRVEETFRTGKGLAGLDEHQVRRFTSWVRWVTLAMLAHAFLAVVRADEHARHPAPDGLIPLTCNEIQRLFTMLVVRPVRDAAHRLRWSDWRRRHQARAQASHYRRQAAKQT
jgi:hypothetical protein